MAQRCRNGWPNCKRTRGCSQCQCLQSAEHFEMASWARRIKVKDAIDVIIAKKKIEAEEPSKQPQAESPNAESVRA